MRLFPAITLASVLLSSTTLSAWAQEYETVITLDTLPSEVNAGDTLIFSGQLITSDGQFIIPGRTIYIKDDVSFGTDTILGSIVTDDNGEYAGSWVAEMREGGGAYDFYAVFEGEQNISEARSQTHSVYVIGSNEESFQTLPEYFPTEIELDPIPSSVYAGESIIFTGILTSDGDPVQNALIKIMEDDPLLSDQILSSGYTDADGTFTIAWQVSKDSVETDFDVYATFDSDGNFEYARSANQIISVLRFSGSITLDPLPNEAQIGDVLMLTGMLELSQGSAEGAIVYIKDEDPYTRDDLLATAYVNEKGAFSANWFVTEVDADLEADIYAVFEGNDYYYRLTTCDPNPTMDYGGACDFTIPLVTYYGDVVPPDSSTAYSEDQYMDLFYTLDFSDRPRVAIVPNPDAYDLAYRYIGATQEGILMWASHMDGKYGGDWDVEFEVVNENDLFFSSEPDVIVNLVTPEQEEGCYQDYYGVAWISSQPQKPIQTSVCVVFGNTEMSTSDVSATAAHEFIHAVGLGHTWNVQGDLMCSIEEVDGKATNTCPNMSLGKSKVPSELNIAAVAWLYGDNGFANPNNDVEYKSKFWPGQEDAVFNTEDTPFIVTGTEVQPEPDPESAPIEPESGDNSASSNDEAEQDIENSEATNNEITNEEQQLSGSSNNSNTPSSGGGCLIATAAFGSELTPQVQFLRNFRDNHILSTAAGSGFMNVFNSWYYSFSHHVADYEREQPWLQQTVKAAIYPLLGILQVSEKAYSTIPGEYGALSAGLVASAMIGAVYFSPVALSIKRVRKSKLNYKVLVCVTAVAPAAVIGAIISGNETALMSSTAAFVLVVVSVSAILFAKFLYRLAEIRNSSKWHSSF